MKISYIDFWSECENVPVNFNEINNKLIWDNFCLSRKLKVVKEGVGLFVWAKLPNGITSAEKFIDDILYEKSIFITPGTIFGSNGEGYIRFALCVKEEKIEEAIDRF
jgi:aspartate/methionine/tyrosine aminotransferase